jgi:uncharacterized cupredoxin-like copper-binding protein
MWVYRSIGVSRPKLVEALLNCEDHNARAAATRQLRYTLGAEGMPSIPNLSDNGFSMAKAISLLKDRVNDPNGIVRMEAANAASYLGTREALTALTDIFQYPMQEHLKFAIRCAIGSEALSRFWQGNRKQIGKSEVKTLSDFYENWDKGNVKKDILLAGGASASGFDRQKDLFTIEISTIPERMLFTVEKFTVKAGQPIRLLFTNPDATQHNFVLIQPGTNESVGMAANEMAKDPSGVELGFIPNHPAIIQYTNLISPDGAQVLRFNAPDTPGVYPYICTFPGHWFIMKGEMIVE